MHNAKNNYNKYIFEVGVYYLYFVLMTLEKANIYAHKIRINYNDDIIVFKDLLKNDFKNSIKNIKFLSANQKIKVNDNLDLEKPFIERFIYMVKEVVCEKKSFNNLELLMKNDISYIIKMYFDLDYFVCFDSVIAEIKKMIINIKKHKNNGEKITILLPSDNVDNRKINTSNFIDTSGERLIENATDFSRLYNLYLIVKNKLNWQICRTNEALGQKIAKVVKSIFNDYSEESNNNRAQGIVSVSNLFIDYYASIIQIEIIKKRIQFINELKNENEINNLVTNQKDFISSDEINNLLR